MKRGRKPLEEILTDEQKEFILREYPNSPCCDIAKELGIRVGSLRGYTHRNHIYKSKEYISKVRRIAGEKARESGHHFPKGFKRQFPSKESEDKWRESISKGLKELWHKERLRVQYGLPQRTKLRLGDHPKCVRLLKYRLRQKGYIIDDKKRIAYWDENTKRSMVMEKRKVWYSFASVYKEAENVNDVNATDSQPRFVPEPPPVNDIFAFT